MANIRRQRLKAIRAGVPVLDANKANSTSKLIELMNKNKKKVGVGEDVPTK